MKFKEATRMVSFGKMSIYSPYWRVCNKNGLNVAAWAAKNGKLPREFIYKQTALFITRVKDGGSPVYYYIMNNKLPLDFPHWEIVNYYSNDIGIPLGTTVAHLAAYNNTLPKDFYKTYPELFIQSDKHGYTPAHYYVIKNKLPLEFTHWFTCDNFEEPIVEVAAFFSTLPDGFKDMYPEEYTNAMMSVKKKYVDEFWGYENNWLSKNQF